MACATIHLAIAKKYLKTHATLNYREVIAGYIQMQQIIMKNHIIQI